MTTVLIHVWWKYRDQISNDNLKRPEENNRARDREKWIEYSARDWNAQRCNNKCIHCIDRWFDVQWNRRRSFAQFCICLFFVLFLLFLAFFALLCFALFSVLFSMRWMDKRFCCWTSSSSPTQRKPMRSKNIYFMFYCTHTWNMSSGIIAQDSKLKSTERYIYRPYLFVILSMEKYCNRFGMDFFSVSFSFSPKSLCCSLYRSIYMCMNVCFGLYFVSVFCIHWNYWNECAHIYKPLMHIMYVYMQ